MRIKHLLKLKEQTNQETWVILTRYNHLGSVLYQLHKDFRYMVSKTKNKNPYSTFQITPKQYINK